MPEFPVINPSKLGGFAQFVWFASYAKGPGLPLFDGAVKFDVASGEVVGRITYGPNMYGGECLFVAKAGAVQNGISAQPYRD